MLAIQVILTVLALALFGVFTQRAHTVRTQAVKRIGFVLFIFSGIYAIFRPQDVNWVAHQLGVGRGADLVLYMLVAVVAFFAANTFLRFRNLERRFTDLARAVALSDAVVPAPRAESEPKTEQSQEQELVSEPKTGSDAADPADASEASEVSETSETSEAAVEEPVPAASGRLS